MKTSKIFIVIAVVVVVPIIKVFAFFFAIKMTIDCLQCGSLELAHFAQAKKLIKAAVSKRPLATLNCQF